MKYMVMEKYFDDGRIILKAPQGVVDSFEASSGRFKHSTFDWYTIVFDTKELAEKYRKDFKAKHGLRCFLMN